MELVTGIKARRSIRAFTPQPVSAEILAEILQIATRAPSGVNSQPWEFLIVRGKVLNEIKQAYLEAYRLGEKPAPEIPVGATKGVSPVLEGVFKERQIELAKQIFRVVGIVKGDTKGLEQWNESMLQFYGSPAVIIILVDRVLQGSWPILDIGLVTQNIVLLAQEYGLGTCIMRAIVDYPERLRKIAGIPESKRIIIGIAVGYPDKEHPVNQLTTPRERIENLVTLVE